MNRAFVVAWNQIVIEKESLITKWKLHIKSGEPLVAMRANQMQQLTSQGKISSAFPELVQMILEKVEVHNEGEFVFYFLDGTSMKVSVKA